MTTEDPEHYKYGGIETVDFMRAKSTPEEFSAYCKLSALKYISRAGKKDGASALDDAKKAAKFCEWWVESLDQSGTNKQRYTTVCVHKGWTIARDNRYPEGRWGHDAFRPGDPPMCQSDCVFTGTVLELIDCIDAEEADKESNT